MIVVAVLMRPIVRPRSLVSVLPSLPMRLSKLRTLYAMSWRPSIQDQKFSLAGCASVRIICLLKNMAFCPLKSGKSVVDKVRGLTEESEGFDGNFFLSKFT